MKNEKQCTIEKPVHYLQPSEGTRNHRFIHWKNTQDTLKWNLTNFKGKHQVCR